MTTDNDIKQLSEQKRTFGQAICKKIMENIIKLGFSDPMKIKVPIYSEAAFNVVTDPYTQSQDLVGYWYDAKQQRIGQLRFHGDGSFYAEYDIVLPHPKKARYFVEAINAWGNEQNIKTEPKLLEMPE
ncbi:MAG: hypothetical protein IPN42_10080 [Methylococcaceae bacterium]|nr:hypothetical protein [Methylococcaceae bacterium]